MQFGCHTSLAVKHEEYDDGDSGDYHIIIIFFVLDKK